jgi:hypothetical protein
MTGGNWRAVRWAVLITVLLTIVAIVIFRNGSSKEGPSAAPPWLQSVASATATATSPQPSPKPSIPSNPPKSPHTVAPSVTAKITPAAGGHISVAVFDRETGRQLTVNGSERYHTASIVKVDILATLLWQKQQAGTALTASQKSLAYQMITVSDNDAADALWALIGKQSGLAHGNQIFGLTHTTPGTTTVHPWGQTLTTVGDQLTLLRVLTEPGGPLTSASQSYILGLMGSVVSSQRWGIPKAAAHPTSVYVKNGWLGEQSDSWLWIVNSIGRIVEPGHDFLIVTLSDHSKTENAGIAAVENAAKVAVSGLRAKP